MKGNGLLSKKKQQRGLEGIPRGLKPLSFLEAGSVRAKARTYLRGNGKYYNGITIWGMDEFFECVGGCGQGL